MVYTKNYYHVLGLESPIPLRSSPTNAVSDAEIRKAYKNALLSAHPDKAKAKKGTYTVDDVKAAYTVLADAKARAEFDRWLAAQPVRAGLRGRDEGQTHSDDFVLGLDMLDLSDFDTTTFTARSQSSSPTSSSSADVDAEDSEAQEEVMVWTRACRCGADKGFRITERELVDAEKRGDKEVLVGCEGCSLWVRVGFDVEEG